MEETKGDETKVEETARIYPSLSQLKISELNKEKHKDRVRYMKDKESQLLLRLEHYKKLRKRWSKVKNVTQGIGIVRDEISFPLTHRHN